MNPPLSAVFRVQDIPNAGRGILATQRIRQGTKVLKSSPPAAHVIFRQYRKEVCARCFRYELGRTLPVRHASTGKVFCSAQCQEQWLAEESELNLKAWQSLHSFVQARTKDVANDYEDLPDRGDKPDTGRIEGAWIDAEKQISAVSNGRKARNKHARTKALPIDPDILGYLLSSLLTHHQSLEQWRAAVLTLAQDPTPYRSTHDLSIHTSSYIHLSTLLPPPLLSSCTPETCQQAVSAASHNSFGIRSEDGEEYTGYALYPDASYFNHSCAPNISKARIGSEWVFTASRDIEVGEECCITYLGGDEKEMDVNERRARLMEHWGFECMCKRCRAESGSAAE